MAVVEGAAAAGAAGAAKAGFGAAIASGAKAVGSWLASNSGALITGGASLLGGLFGSHRSGHMKDFWGAAKYADWANARADARSLDMSKDLYYYQNVAGPGQMMEGYRRAGLNPVLAGNFNASMPTLQASNQQAQYPVGQTTRDKGAAIVNAIGTFLQARELESRIALNENNAYAVAARAETDNQLRDYKKALTYYKAVNESNMPAKLKSQLMRDASETLLNTFKAGLYQSQQLVNAKQLDNIQSQIDYRNHMKFRSYFNLPFGLGRGYIGDIIINNAVGKAVENSGNSQKEFGKAGVPFQPSLWQ